MMVEVVCDDGGGEEFAEGDHLVVVVVVGMVRGVEALAHGVEPVQQAVDLACERHIAWNERVGDAEVVVLELGAEGLRRGVGGVGEGARDEFLQQVGGLAHGGDHHHQRL